MTPSVKMEKLHNGSMTGLHFKEDGKMKIKITYKVCGVEFSATATCVSEAYEYLQAIIKANAINFPRQAETLSEYMCILVKIQNGETIKSENHIFRLEKVVEEKS